MRLDCVLLASGGDHELYLFRYGLTGWHVGFSAPLKTEPQHTNHILFLTQSVDPGQGLHEGMALSVLPYGLMRTTTYTVASLRKVYWVVHFMAADQFIWLQIKSSGNSVE
jgi:hypothetical protein